MTPDESSTKVFSSGTSNGLKVIIPDGGHVLPSSKVGDSLLWKKAQKKETKKKTSETINNNMPQRSPSSTILECRPWQDASNETSRHHWAITRRIIEIPINIREGE